MSKKTKWETLLIEALQDGSALIVDAKLTHGEPAEQTDPSTGKISIGIVLHGVDCKILFRPGFIDKFKEIWTADNND